MLSDVRLRLSNILVRLAIKIIIMDHMQLICNYILAFTPPASNVDVTFAQVERLLNKLLGGIESREGYWPEGVERSINNITSYKLDVLMPEVSLT